jgi:hypothetical protein
MFERKEFKMNLLQIGNDFGFCEICDNHTPRVTVYGENACQYCWEAYGEIN